MTTAKNAKTPEASPTAEKRDDTTDAPVTELAQVDGDTSTKTLKQMSGVSDEPYKPSEKPDAEASTQQKDALEGLKQARDDADGKERDEDVNPHNLGPGGMVA